MASSVTIDRILEASLGLFNEHGFQSVTILKIATQAGISPGNLSYHFKSKTDIVLAVFPRIEEEIRTVVLEGFVPGRAFLPADGALHTIAVFRILWRYRFFFDALNHLLSDEPELRTRYMALQESIISASEEAIGLVVKQEKRPMAYPTTPRMLARNWWQMWLGWLAVEQLEHARGEMVPDQALFEGALQTHSIVQPYFGSAFTADFIAALHAVLPAIDGVVRPLKPAVAVAKGKRSVVRKSSGRA